MYGGQGGYFNPTSLTPKDPGSVLPGAIDPRRFPQGSLVQNQDAAQKRQLSKPLVCKKNQVLAEVDWHNSAQIEIAKNRFFNTAGTEIISTHRAQHQTVLFITARHSPTDPSSAFAA